MPTYADESTRQRELATQHRNAAMDAERRARSFEAGDRGEALVQGMLGEPFGLTLGLASSSGQAARRSRSMMPSGGLGPIYDVRQLASAVTVRRTAAGHEFVGKVILR